MRSYVTVHQLATGHGAYLNVRDLYPVGAAGFDVWGSVMSPEVRPDANVAALVLGTPVCTSPKDPGIRTFHLMSFDDLTQFNHWRAQEGMRFERIYLITPNGLELLAPKGEELPHQTEVTS